MKIEWFVQYYYSAEDVYKAKKMQWVVTIASVLMQYMLVNMRPSGFLAVVIFCISIWIFWGYEKAKCAYRKNMNQCKNNVSDEMSDNWHTYQGKELTWKRDRWITIPQIGLMFVFMVLAIRGT